MADQPVVRSAVLNTVYGPVDITVLAWLDEDPYVALRHRDPGDAVVLRVQAQCLTGTAFASTMCDCAAQIRAGTRLCATVPGAVLVHLPQEGRGYGLLSKVEIMAEMNRGRSLRAAQHAVGRAESRLNYRRVPAVLETLGIRTPVRLVTQSTQKAEALWTSGVRIAETIAFPGTG